MNTPMSSVVVVWSECSGLVSVWDFFEHGVSGKVQAMTLWGRTYRIMDDYTS